MFRCMIYDYDLISATVAEITNGWRTTQVVDIERAAVSHLNVSGPLIAA